MCDAPAINGDPRSQASSGAWRNLSELADSGHNDSTSSGGQRVNAQNAVLAPRDCRDTLTKSRTRRGLAAFEILRVLTRSFAGMADELRSMHQIDQLVDPPVVLRLVQHGSVTYMELCDSITNSGLSQSNPGASIRSQSRTNTMWWMGSIA